MKWRQKGIQGCLHVRFHNVLMFVLYLYITLPLEDDSTIDGKGSPINVFLNGGVTIFADKFLMHSLRVGNTLGFLFTNKTTILLHHNDQSDFWLLLLPFHHFLTFFIMTCLGIGLDPNLGIRYVRVLKALERQKR